MQTFNHPSQITRRRALRRAMTAPEQKLWWRLRNNQTGYRFRRQHGIGAYIVDFYCASGRLVIEVDGESHFCAGARVSDVEREVYLRALGLSVLRFTNAEVMENVEGVVVSIVAVLEREVGPPLSPPR